MPTVIRIAGTRVIFNGGQFDSDFRYLRRTDTGARTTMLAGPSIAVNFDSSSWRISWRYKCGSYTVTGVSETPAAPSNVTNTPADIAL